MAACGKHELGAAAVGVYGHSMPTAFPLSVLAHLWKSQGGSAADGLMVLCLLTWGFYDSNLFLIFLKSTFSGFSPPFGAVRPLFFQPGVPTEAAHRCQHLRKLLKRVLPTPALPRALLPAVFAPCPHSHPVRTGLSAATPDPGKGRMQLWMHPGGVQPRYLWGMAPQEGMQRFASLGSGVLAEQNRASGWDVL